MISAEFLMLKENLLWATNTYKGQMPCFDCNVFEFRDFLKLSEGMTQALSADRNIEDVNRMLLRAEEVGFSTKFDLEIKILWGKQTNVGNTIGGFFGSFKPNWMKGTVKFTQGGAEKLYNGITQGRSLKQDIKSVLLNSYNQTDGFSKQVIYEVQKGYRDFHSWVNVTP